MKRPLAIALAIAAAGSPAEAHGSLPGGGGFYAGLAHPFLAWEHLLLALALGLLMGRQARAATGRPLAALAVALGAGLVLGGQSPGWVDLPVTILGLGVIVGSFVVADLRVPRVALALLCVAAGGAIGLDTGVPPSGGATLIEAAAPYAGVVVGLFLIVLDAMALAFAAAHPPWSIGVRILGSWIVAACLMVLALSVRRIMDGG